jgi:hypothetical protein
MAEKSCVRKIEVEYSYDRFATLNLLQVYQSLLPSFQGGSDTALVTPQGECCENSGHLRTGFIRKTERRKHHR